MAFNDDDRITGTWVDPKGKSQPVHFKKTWRGHTFTDDEGKKLLGGATITVDCKSRAGDKYKSECKLDYNTFTNDKGKKITYIGPVKPEGVPLQTCGHVFTDKEKAALEGGQEILVKNLKSKKGNTFDAYLSYGERTYKGHTGKGIKFRFPDDNK